MGAYGEHHGLLLARVRGQDQDRAVVASVWDSRFRELAISSFPQVGERAGCEECCIFRIPCTRHGSGFGVLRE